MSAAPVSFQLPACGLEKQLRMTQSLRTLPPRGAEEVLDLWFLTPGWLSSTVAAIWAVNQQMRNLFVSPSFYKSVLYIYISVKP